MSRVLPDGEFLRFVKSRVRDARRSAARAVNRRISAYGFFLLCLGCASLKPEAFHGFQNSVSVARKGLETEMARNVAWTREADVQYLANRKDAPLSAYMVKEARGYEWSMDALPPHGDARQTLKTLEELNAAFGAYAALLADAAKGQIKDEADFDGRAASLNDSLRDLKEALAELKTSDKAPIAGVSAFAAGSLRLFVENRRAKDLEKAVRENQPLVQGYAAQCRSLILLVRSDLKAAYADQVEALHDKWDDKRSPGRITLTRSLFNLNEEYASAMEILQALDAAYTMLPGAHGDLAEGVAHSRKPRAALSALARSAEHVARLTQDLEKSR